MRLSMQSQILLPFALLSVTAVAVTAIVSAGVAASRRNEEHAQQVRTMVRSLQGARFPYTESVLEKMKGLSGAEFVALGPQEKVAAATLPIDKASIQLPSQVPTADAIRRITDLPVVEVHGVRYFAASVPANNAGRPVSLYLLYAQRTWEQDRWAAVWPPLLVGLAAAVVATALSAWLARRFGRRIGVVRGQLSQLAAKDYVQVPPAAPQDELFDLQCSANQLAGRLTHLEEEVIRTERLRLLAQLAGGLAHQLRNAVTGARMAVQIHARRCHGPAADESLEIALRQLSLTEEQVRGLLSLAARRPQEQTPGDLREIVCDVEKLVWPMCKHAGVSLECQADLDESLAQVSDAALLRAALVNLALNAIEAAGEKGSVWLHARADDAGVELCVADTGQGPPESLRETLFEPFVTSKPEGVGIGLALARQAAASCGGTLDFARRDDKTVFTMRWPRPAAKEARSTAADNAPAQIDAATGAAVS
ncbi:MAG: HAMP domain-containing histidine kinase [Planctomycetia bacterium]|nr:HAMP domain-containing histidine kinase [Planctomycetia bacterium]